jgi:tetratricopeptide (TPR) repeat protein
MRIECDKCNAAFTIGDALLSDQPIGAQCPYCGNVKVVSKGDAGGGARASAPPAPGYHPDPSGAMHLNFGTPAPEVAPSWQQSQQPRIADPMSGLGAPSSHGSGAPEAAAGGSGKCQVCGIALVDEFDKVIGLCEQHQRERGGQGDFSGASRKGGAESEWRVRTGDGGVLGPFSLTELRSRLQRNEFQDSDQFGKDAGEFGPLSSHPELRAYTHGETKGELETARPIRGDRRAKRSNEQAPMRPQKRGGSFGTVVLALLVLGLIGAGGFAFFQADKVKQLYEDIFAKAKPPAPLPPNPLKKVLSKWRAAQPDMSGTATERLAEARSRHLEDTWRGYQLAQNSLKAALLLDEDNPTAIASYVENLVVWRDQLLTDEEFKIAQGAIHFAQAKKPDDSTVLRALAELDLVRGDLAGCRGWAEKAVEHDKSDGEAHLLLAQSYLEGNATLAIQEGEQAAKLVPALRRTDRLLARAYANAGRYASALKIMEQRVKVDPTNSAIQRLYGDIERDLAQLDSARKHYIDSIKNEGDVMAGYLALAELQLEVGDLPGALETFGKVSRSADSPPGYKATALAASSRAEIARGRLPKAADLASQALAIRNKDAVALLTKAEVAFETGSSSAAITLAQRALESRSGEPVGLVLLARAAVQAKQSEQAIKYFEEAVQNDPKDPRLRALLAAGYLAFGGSSQAFTVMRQAGEIDPLERQARHRKGVLALSSLPLKEAIDRFRKVAEDPRNRSVALSSIAIIHYETGDQARAKEIIDEALKADESNVSALIYSAQLALDRGAPERAIENARRILDADRGSAMGHLMLARSYQQQNKLDDAKEEFSSALRSAPGMLAAQVELAGIQLKNGTNRAEAIEALTRAYRIAPHDLRTRLLLLSAGV